MFRDPRKLASGRVCRMYWPSSAYTDLWKPRGKPSAVQPWALHDNHDEARALERARERDGGNGGGERKGKERHNNTADNLIATGPATFCRECQPLLLHQLLSVTALTQRSETLSRRARTSQKPQAPQQTPNPRQAIAKTSCKEPREHKRREINVPTHVGPNVGMLIDDFVQDVIT